MQEQVQLPDGYNWSITNQADDTGITCCVTLRASRHKPGSIWDRWFGRGIITHILEFDSDTDTSVINEKIREKQLRIRDSIL